MPIYAHVTGANVDAVGYPPEKVFEGGRWWDLRPMTPAILNPRGWFVVTEVARPADTATHTTDYSVILVAGIPTQTWTSRPWTAAEQADRTAETNAVTIEAQAAAALATNKTFVAIVAPSTAQNAAQIKALTRQMNGLIRLVIRRLDATD